MKVITLTSCSSSGKDTILNRVLLENKVKPIISTTSRPIRNGEIQGREYNFVTHKEAMELLNNGLFIEHRLYYVANGNIWVYGITKDSIDINSDDVYIVIVDFKGLKELENKLGKENIISFYINTSCQERLKRSLLREGNMNDIQVQEVCRRLLDDEINVKPASKHCTLVLENENMEDLDSCVSIIGNIIKHINIKMGAK
ncbi:MAG: hypothetical protein ACRDD7_13390 [Peptostreptococcaceae bacterium]